MAGSVMPNKAEIPDAEQMDFILSFFVIRSTARTAAPWATLFMLAVEKMKLPPVWALSASSCVSMAIKLWCMPVMVIGAYANPKSAPPTGPRVL